MRFLLGILVGAGLTLLVATAVDAPTNPIVQQLATGWRQFIELTSRALFPPPSAAAEVAGARQPSADASDVASPAPADSIVAASPRAPLPEQQDAQVRVPVQPAAEDQAATSAPEEERAPAASTDVERLIAAADRELGVLGRRKVTERPAGEPPAESETGAVPTGDNARTDAPDVATSFDVPALSEDSEDSVDGDDLAGVWSPFHSERSAEGFARRLSDQFRYPFSVERIGPGAYQVVFSYTDPAERDALLAEIAEVTGP